MATEKSTDRMTPTRNADEQAAAEREASEQQQRQTTTGDYRRAVVLVNRHEPEHEAAGRLLELAEEKGYDPRVVELQRGEHDTPLSFRVPEDVAEGFNADRASRWPSDKIENDEESDADQRAIPGDAYAADNIRRAQEVRAANVARAENENPVRARTGKPKE